MLFLYAKLNPGQGYVQGMNEIIGPIYHTFAIDPDKEYRRKSQTDKDLSFEELCLCNGIEFNALTLRSSSSQSNPFRDESHGQISAESKQKMIMISHSRPPFSSPTRIWQAFLMIWLF